MSIAQATAEQPSHFGSTQFNNFDQSIYTFRAVAEYSCSEPSPENLRSWPAKRNPTIIPAHLRPLRSLNILNSIHAQCSRR